MCSSTGETLDINRFDTDENDLADAAYEYRHFKSDTEILKSSKEELIERNSNPRLKIIDIDWFINNVSKSWVIDNNWTDEEKIALGIKDEEESMTANEFAEFIDKVIIDLTSFKGNTKCLR